MSRFSEENQQFSNDDPASTHAKSANTPLGWWYRISGPSDMPESSGFRVREQIRRSRVGSLLILGTICAALLLVSIIIIVAPTTFLITQAWIVTAIGIACCLFAIPFNRRRQVSVVGVLLIVAVDVIVAGIILSERDGLDPLVLSLFDLLTVTELIAASLLTPSSVFTIAFLNVMMVVADINLQPHSMMWMQMIPNQQIVYSLILRPVILYFVVAAVAYLWVTSALTALKRADRAELIAELERREVERSHQIEEAVEQILAVHVRVANGDLNARAPVYQNKMLWQVGLALNNLLSRFKSTAHAEYNLQRVEKEVADLRMSLRQWRRGDYLRWYPPGQTLLGPLVDDLRYILTPEYIPQPNNVPQSAFPSAARPPSLEQPRTPNPARDRSLHGLTGPAENQNPARDRSLHGLTGPAEQQREWPRVSNTPMSRPDPTSEYGS